MKVKRLAISGYRNLGQVTVDFEDDLTVFVGANDSGKSNIVRAVEFVLNLLKQDFEIQIPHEGGRKGSLTDEAMEFTRLTDFRAIEGNVRGEIIAELTVQLADIEVGLAFSELKNSEEFWNICPPENLSRITFTVAAEGRRVNEENVLKCRLLQIHSGEGVDIFKRNEGKVVCLSGADNGKLTHSTDASLVPRLVSTVFGDASRETDTLVVVPAERTVSPFDKDVFLRGNIDPKAFGKWLYDNSTKAERYNRGVVKELKRDFNVMFPDYDEFRPMDEGHQGSPEGPSDVFFDRIPSTQIGSGVKQVIECLRIIREYKSPIIAIEEPEIHLHPDKQRQFFRYVREIVEGRQLIVTTHSPTIISESPNESIRLVRNSGGRAEIVQIRDDESGFLNIATELGILPRDIFEFEIAVLVEDDTSRRYFEKAVRAFCKNSARIGVMDVGGWTSMTVWVNSVILTKLNREYIVVFDGDLELDTKKKDQKKRYLAKTKIESSKIVTLNKPNIEHYISNPAFVSRAFPKLKEAVVAEYLVGCSERMDVKGELNRLFVDKFSRGFSNEDAALIIEKLEESDFPNEIQGIVKSLDKGI